MGELEIFERKVLSGFWGTQWALGAKAQYAPVEGLGQPPEAEAFFVNECIQF